MDWIGGLYVDSERGGDMGVLRAGLEEGGLDADIAGGGSLEEAGPLTARRAGGLPAMVWRRVIGEGVRGAGSSVFGVEALVSALMTALREMQGPDVELCHGDAGLTCELMLSG